MRYRQLGTSDLRVSEIGRGSWLTYAGGVAAYATRACTEAAFEVGIANDAGLGLVELALGWVLRRSELASAIVGASRLDQVRANAAASGLELSADVLAAIDDALADAPVKGQTLAVLATAGVTHRTI